MSTSATAPETIEMPSPEALSLEITTSAPLRLPTVKSGALPSPVDSDLREKMPVVVMSEPLHPLASAVESDSDLEDGEIAEFDRSMTPEVGKNGERGGATNSVRDDNSKHTVNSSAGANALPLTEIEGDEEDSLNPPPADTKTTAIDDTPGPDHEETSLGTIDLPHTIREANVSPEAGSSVKEKDRDKVADEAHVENEKTAIGSQRHEVTATAPSQSVPPHTRPALEAPNAQYCRPQEARVSQSGPRCRVTLMKNSHAGGRPYLAHLAATTPRLDMSLFDHFTITMSSSAHKPIS